MIENHEITYTFLITIALFEKKNNNDNSADPIDNLGKKKRIKKNTMAPDLLVARKEQKKRDIARSKFLKICFKLYTHLNGQPEGHLTKLEIELRDILKRMLDISDKISI